MPTCIAFLRAVNVGGRTVKMDLLRAEFEALGLAEVRSFIASGNVVFTTRARDLAALERRIEQRLHAAFGFEIETFVRTRAELAAIVAHPAFDAAEAAAAATHVIGFIGTAPGAEALSAVAAFTTAHDRFHLHERELHWLSALRQSDSTFSNAAFERALRTRATFRSITTLRKLLATLPDA
ncbi:MAG TPA: DUF1697 domain-containing protein [Burkholderiaceae bacterium]|nr:DUF1697 domain-containing protein [Burkholderiaceae bacterium]